ncbi:MAG: hypothetical protein ACT4PT_00360 [Methanobacteriota archaeon]
MTVRLDEVLPRYDVRTRHEIDVAAPRDRVWPHVAALDLSSVPLVRRLFALRGGLPLSREGLERAGFVVLSEIPREELVLGVAGRFWRPRGDLQPLDAEAFRSFERPGYAKAVWEFRLEPYGPVVTRLSTETRVACFGRAARFAFRAYWLLVGPGSSAIRRAMLRAIARRATGDEPRATKR